MKQHQFVLSTFLVLGLLTLFIGVYPDVTTTTTTFKARSKNTTKKVKVEKTTVEVETVSKVDSICHHPGVSHIVLSVVSGYAKIKKSSLS